MVQLPAFGAILGELEFGIPRGSARGSLAAYHLVYQVHFRRFVPIGIDHPRDDAGANYPKPRIFHFFTKPLKRAAVE